MIASSAISIYSILDMNVLLEQALKLGPLERQRLADYLYRSLDDAGEVTVSAEHLAELERRIEYNRQHPEEVVPLEDFLARFNAR